MLLSELPSAACPEYYKPYLQVLGEVELLDQLKNQSKNFPNFIKSIPEAAWTASYAAGKWTIAEVLVHILDTERVFQYRALRFGRNDKTSLPGFDQDLYVPQSRANQRSKQSVLAEYSCIRAASVSLFETFSKEELNRQGTASGVPISVAALGFIICGHQKHHRNIIRQRYLNTDQS